MRVAFLILFCLLVAPLAATVAASDESQPVTTTASEQSPRPCGESITISFLGEVDYRIPRKWVVILYGVLLDGKYIDEALLKEVGCPAEPLPVSGVLLRPRTSVPPPEGGKFYLPPYLRIGVYPDDPDGNWTIEFHRSRRSRVATELRDYISRGEILTFENGLYEISRLSRRRHEVDFSLYIAPQDVYMTPDGEDFVIDCWPLQNSKERECRVWYSMSVGRRKMNVRYRFIDTDVPKPYWIAMDKVLIAELRSMKIDTRRVYPESIEPKSNITSEPEKDK